MSIVSRIVFPSSLVLLFSALPASAAPDARVPALIGTVKRDGGFGNSAVQASERYLGVETSEYDDGNRQTLFDLQTGASRLFRGQLVGQGGLTWKLNPTQLTLRDDLGAGKAVVYPIPAALVRAIERDLKKPWQNRVSLNEKQVTLLTSGAMMRWNRQTRALEQTVNYEAPDAAQTVLSRDGKTLIQAMASGVRRMPVGGGVTQTTAFAGGAAPLPALVGLSNFGTYAFCDTKGNPPDFRVVDTRTGRDLWRFQLEDYQYRAVASPDETIIALPISRNNIWEIRELATGKLLRTVPLTFDVHGGVFSPDSRTLYYVSKERVLAQNIAADAPAAPAVGAPWQPVALGDFSAPVAFNFGPQRTATASQRYFALDSAMLSLFDLKTAKSQTFDAQPHITPNGAWRCEIDETTPHQLKVSDGEKPPVTYDVPAAQTSDFAEGKHPFFRVSSRYNAVVLCTETHYYRWNLATRQLQRQVKLADVPDRKTPYFTPDPKIVGAYSLSRDGEDIVHAGTKGISVLSTRSGQRVRYTPLEGIEFFQNIVLSPFGSHALYDGTKRMGGERHWRVVDTRDGRVKWRLENPDNPGNWPPQSNPFNAKNPAFTPDEKSVAFPFAELERWEIRDLATGAIERPLPLAKHDGKDNFAIDAYAQTGAFSPDGATLYSVAGGKLYRQRAR